MPAPSPERAAAIAAGEKSYFTGKPCKNGHIAKRYVHNNACSICATARTRACQAKKPWHPARTAARERSEMHYSTGTPCIHGHDRRWVSNGVCAECGVRRSREWDARNPDYDHTAKTRERRRKNPEKHRSNVKRWAQANREKVREMLLRWKAANPERMRELYKVGVHNRRAREAANGGSFTADDIAAILLRQDGRCAACPSEENLEIDHIVSVLKGGSSDPSNLQLLCLPCNRSKGTKGMQEWLQRKLK